MNFTINISGNFLIGFGEVFHYRAKNLFWQCGDVQYMIQVLRMFDEFMEAQCDTNIVLKMIHKNCVAKSAVSFMEISDKLWQQQTAPIISYQRQTLHAKISNAQ